MTKSDNKENFLKELDTALRFEEDFMKSFDNEDTWNILKTLPKEKFVRIEKLLKENLDETDHHRMALEMIIKEVQNGA